MKPVQVTFDEQLLRAIDRHLKGHRRSRSAFIRECVRHHLERVRTRDLGEQERRGYQRKPVRKGEFDVLYPRQDWGPE